MKNNKQSSLPINKKEVLAIKRTISAMDNDEKDLMLATALVILDHIADILKLAVVEKKPLGKEQEAEIESIISLGPPWLRYSRKVKRVKK
ncbi:MAG TPA: hypothetical protein VJJ73_01605 [Candidatus Paceibacterota bacterium]